MPTRSVWRNALSHLGLTLTLALTASVGLGAACNGSGRTRPPDRASASASASGATPARATPALRLYYLVDLDGYLEPCGCQSRPLGGIDRLARFMETERARAPHSLFVAVGDLLFRDPELESRMVFQETAKAESMVRILDQLHLSAYAPGPSDFVRGGDEWRRLAGASQGAVALVANRPAAEASAAPPFVRNFVVREVNGVRVGLVGVSDFREHEDGSPPQGALATTDPVPAAREAVQQARAQGAQVVVVLASVMRRQAVAIARAIDGVDFVIAAREESPRPPPPERVGNAYVLTATNQGKGVGVVDLYLRPGASAGAFTDASEATSAAQRGALDRRITELRERIAGWERDQSADRAAVEQQRARLAQLERERAALGNGALSVPDAPRWFDARVQEINPDVPRQQDIEQTVGRYFREVNEHNRVEYASLRAPAPSPGQPHYEGDESCRDCHEEAYQIWQRTPHSAAYHTLEVVSKNYNLACVSCHVTGYRQPGGAEVVQNEGRRDVQCESCHGPGSAHVSARTDAARRATIRRNVPGDFCARECHTPEHSDHFNYETYLPRILGPGHGFPADSAGGGIQLSMPVLAGGQNGAHPAHAGFMSSGADGGAGGATADGGRAAH